MGTVFMNSKNDKRSDLHRLLLNLSEKINLKTRYKYVALSNFSNTIHRKIQKDHTKTIILKYHLWRGMKRLNYLMDHNMHQIFKIILSISSKSVKPLLFAHNPPLIIYVYNGWNYEITWKH